MKRLPILFLLLCLLGACSHVSPEEMASLAAEGYYKHLMKGEYEAFLEGKSGLEDAPDDYREQMLAVFKQYRLLQEKEHRGILDVRVSNATTDTLQHYVSVFLVLCYGDSTNEEIVVPMVEHDGRWRMK